MTEHNSLPDRLRPPADVLRSLEADYDRFARDGLPPSVESYLLDRYRLDVAAEYAGFPLKNPWGKASGQLSMTARQVEEDVAAGLGFVVLKTVIAQNESGAQAMQDWAQRESRMVVEPITGPSGEQGWTVTWKGRGWWQSFDDYLRLIRDAQRLAAGTGTLIVPSCKYHLPAPGESEWRLDEYRYTTPRLVAAWRELTGAAASTEHAAAASREHAAAASTKHDVAASSEPRGKKGAASEAPPPMPLEKDFSPTLAGSDRAQARETILDWLRRIPDLIRRSCAAEPSCAPEEKSDQTRAGVRVGLKLFNALFDDDFQLEMLNAIHDAPGRAEFFIYGNRLFDPNREFDGVRGVAYGGPDLSDRNLRVLRRFHRANAADHAARRLLPWSATGNITTGRMALEYALCGASSFQLHTFFQLPADQYRRRAGSRTERALCELYFHPETGFVAGMHHLAAVLGLPRDPLRFADVIGRLNDVPPAGG